MTDTYDSLAETQSEVIAPPPVGHAARPSLSSGHADEARM
jgi:hypothetical protein